MCRGCIRFAFCPILEWHYQDRGAQTRLAGFIAKRKDGLIPDGEALVQASDAKGVTS